MRDDESAKSRSNIKTFELLPRLTVLQNVMRPMDLAQNYSLSKQRTRARHLLDQVEIVEHANKFPAALSGGQPPRVAIAHSRLGAVVLRRGVMTRPTRLTDVAPYGWRGG